MVAVATGAGGRARAILRLCGVALAMLGSIAVAQDVSIRATVDRDSLHVNESFTYVLRAEGQVRGDPDDSVLEQQFEVLQSTTSTRIQIVNGQAEQIAEWIYQLMPTVVGKVTIPPIELAGAFSNPIDLEILPATAAADVPADIFLEVDADPTTAYVQSQVLYTLRLYVGVSTGRATITPPAVSGGEAIIERLGEDRQYRTTRGGRAFEVRERRYAIFPQKAGPLTVGPATLEAMVIPNRGFSRVQRFRSDSVELTVNPAVPPPPEYPAAVWLPAAHVELSESWSDEPSELVVGVPTTRALVVDAQGLLETQLPELQVPQAAGLRQYKDQPDLDRTVTPEGLVARRVERYAVLAQAAGEVELPGVELPWFNVGEQRWEVAELAARRATVAPSAEAPPAQPSSTEPTQPVSETVVSGESSNYWPAVAAVLGLAWIATLFLWWRSRTAHSAAAEARSRAVTMPRRPANRRMLRELRAACARNDATAARSALLEWAALRFPDPPPRSLGALAERLPGPVAAEVLELEAQLYGRDVGGWDGVGLAAVLEHIDSVKRSQGASADSEALLPLYR